jgi:hypothetical protein
MIGFDRVERGSLFSSGLTGGTGLTQERITQA